MKKWVKVVLGCLVVAILGATCLGLGVSYGLFKAFSPRDLIVFGAQGPIDNTLRFPNEPSRHKLLDLIGDLSLAGRPIQARITATRSGHTLNHEMARHLAALAAGG